MHENQPKNKPATKERRTKRRTVFLTVGEDAAIVRKAGAVRVSAYLRRAGLGQALPAVVPAVHLPILSELRGAAGNLNQLARRANAAGNAGAAESFEDALAATLHYRALLRAPAEMEQ